MSINKSEDFVYFQNKAHHYHNIRNAKPHVNDHLDKSYRNTINHSPTNRTPYLHTHSIKVENQHLINRLINISKSKRTEVQVQGYYSRYNNNERSFRKQNPNRDAFHRRIEEENEQIVSRLHDIKPVVGSNATWSQEYHEKLQHKRNMSRYLSQDKSKGSLRISTDRFIPQQYRSFLLKKSLDASGSQNTVTVIPKQKLLALPKILKSERSQSVLNQERSHSTLEV